jgi:hypothetical protein
VGWAAADSPVWLILSSYQIVFIRSNGLVEDSSQRCVLASFFEIGEDVFNGVEVRRVFGQIEQVVGDCSMIVRVGSVL